MRVGAEPSPRGLTPEVIELILAEPALEKGPRIDAGSGVTLVVDLVTRGAVVLAAEEVVETDLVQRCGGGVGGEMAADSVVLLVGPGHHHRRVPTHYPPNPALHLLVAGEPWLLLGRDGVDEVGLHHCGDADLQPLGPRQQLADDVACPARTLSGDQGLE